MKPALQLAASLRKLASGVPLLSDEERQDVKDAAGMLEWVLEHVSDQEQKARAVGTLAKNCTEIIHKERLAAKASTNDEEARRLRAITEGR